MSVTARVDVAARARLPLARPGRQRSASRRARRRRCRASPRSGDMSSGWRIPARVDDGDEGSTLLLTIFFCFLGLSLVLVVVAGDLAVPRAQTALHARRRRRTRGCRSVEPRLRAGRRRPAVARARERRGAAGGCRVPRRRRARARRRAARACGIRRRPDRDGDRERRLVRADPYRAAAALGADRGDRDRPVGLSIRRRCD